MEKLYENIRKRRIELGMTQSELASGLGYADRSAVVRLESGQVDLTFSKILKAARVLDIDPVILMGLDQTAATIAELESMAEMLRAKRGGK